MKGRVVDRDGGRTGKQGEERRRKVEKDKRREEGGMMTIWGEE